MWGLGHALLSGGVIALWLDKRRGDLVYRNVMTHEDAVDGVSYGANYLSIGFGAVFLGLLVWYNYFLGAIFVIVSGVIIWYLCHVSIRQIKRFKYAARGPPTIIYTQWYTNLLTPWKFIYLATASALIAVVMIYLQ
jgi:hypothetical protein